MRPNVPLAKRLAPRWPRTSRGGGAFFFSRSKQRIELVRGRLSPAPSDIATFWINPRLYSAIRLYAGGLLSN